MFAKLKILAHTLRHEIKVYRLVLGHARTPLLAKLLLGLAVGYLLLPFDLIPDFIPVIGHLDDLIIVPMLFWLALKLIPKEIIAESRRRVQDGLPT